MVFIYCERYFLVYKLLLRTKMNADEDSLFWKQHEDEHFWIAAQNNLSFPVLLPRTRTTLFLSFFYKWFSKNLLYRQITDHLRLIFVIIRPVMPLSRLLVSDSEMSIYYYRNVFCSHLPTDIKKYFFTWIFLSIDPKWMIFSLRVSTLLYKDNSYSAQIDTIILSSSIYNNWTRKRTNDKQ